MPLSPDQMLGEQVARLKRTIPADVSLNVVPDEVVIMRDIKIPDGIEIVIEDGGELVLM